MDGLQSLYTPHTVPEIIPLSIPPRRLTRKSDLIVIPNDRPVSRDGLQVTEAEFMADWYDAPDIIYEWCNGILEEKPVSDMEGELMGHWFIRLLNLVIETCAPAHLTATNIGFRLAFSRNTCQAQRNASIGEVAPGFNIVNRLPIPLANAPNKEGITNEYSAQFARW